MRGGTGTGAIELHACGWCCQGLAPAQAPQRAPSHAGLLGVDQPLTQPLQPTGTSPVTCCYSLPCAPDAHPACRPAPAPATPPASGSLQAGEETEGGTGVWASHCGASSPACQGQRAAAWRRQGQHASMQAAVLVWQAPSLPLGQMGPHCRHSTPQAATADGKSPPVTNLSPPSSPPSSPSNQLDSRPSAPAYSCSMFVFSSALHKGGQ